VIRDTTGSFAREVGAGSLRERAARQIGVPP
jgi:hypothetical protein